MDSSSEEGQRRFLLATRVRLGSLVATAVGGGFTLGLGAVDLFGLLSLVALVVAIVAEIYILSARPDRLWYDGRAGAESAKTLTWRYMVGGEPFPKTPGGDGADQAFLERLGEILHDLRDLDLKPVLSVDEQITPEMRTIRALDLDARMNEYKLGRIEDQRQWYSTKSASNRAQSGRWSFFTISLEGLGVIAASMKAFEVVDFDLLGLVAALAAAVTAWSQAKQYEILSRAYFVASQELATIKSQVTGSPAEQEWARFVQEAEEAISREHTLWRASRGVRLRL